MKNPFAQPSPEQRSRPLRWLVPVLLVLLFLAVLIWLPWQARQMESNERQEQLIADTLWVEQTLRFELARSEEALAALGADLVVAPPPAPVLQARFAQMFKNGPELVRVAWLDEAGKPMASHGADLPAAGLSEATRQAAEMAHATRRGRYSEPYGATPSTHGLIDFYLPLYRQGQYAGSLVATYSLQVLLNETVPWWFAQDNALSLLDREDHVVAQRAAGGPGRGVYTHRRDLDLPGALVALSTDSVMGAPKLLPNLLVGSVIVLALGLVLSLVALWRHISRTLAAEAALRQQMAFRTAMENSLLTGLRARDLEGRVTYVNRAFCQIVGLPEEALVGTKPPMPYWAPEAMGDYEERFRGVLAGTITPQFETVYQRSDGVRVPVLVFEAPLVDVYGKQTGWMSSVLDITDRKRVEELNRQQEEKLQASARLATMGEISSMLAHELNQPLAAISSYTAGALNMLERAGAEGAEVQPGLLRRAGAGAPAGPARRPDHPQRARIREEARAAARDGEHPQRGRRRARSDRPAGAPGGRGASRGTAARPAAGAGRPHPARAGAAEPDPQRHRGHAGHAARGAGAAHPGRPWARPGVGVGDRPRPRHRTRGRRAPVFALPLDQGGRHGHGLVDLPHRDRIPRRYADPCAEPGGRDDFHVLAARASGGPGAGLKSGSRTN